MMEGLKAFGIGLGATAGVFLGVYAGVKGIEAIGYLSGKSDARREAQLNAEIEKRVKEAMAAAAVSA